MNKNVIPNLLKAAEVLRQIVAHEEGLTQTEVEQLVDIPKATAFRILTSWCNESFAVKVGKRYYAGMALAQAGLKSLAGMEIRELARPILAELARDSGETAHLAVESGPHSLILEVAESPNAIRAASRAGALADIHCSSHGKIFLAEKEAIEVRELMERVGWVPHTSNTHSSLETLLADLDRVSLNGYAVDDEEYHPGVRCLAVPVRDATGRLMAALGITGTANRFTPDRNDEIGDLVKAAAAELEQNIANAPSRAPSTASKIRR